jgi:hypothetical protein
MDLKKRFSEGRIIVFLQQAEACVAIKALCRQHDFSDASFCDWRAKFCGMTIHGAISTTLGQSLLMNGQWVLQRCRGFDAFSDQCRTNQRGILLTSRRCLRSHRRDIPTPGSRNRLQLVLLFLESDARLDVGVP